MNKVATLSITEARKELLTLPEKFTEDKDLKSIIITKRGKPVFDLVPHGYIETIVETLEIMSNPDQMEALKQSIIDVEQGRLFTMEELKGQAKLIYSFLLSFSHLPFFLKKNHKVVFSSEAVEIRNIMEYLKNALGII